MSIDHTPLSRQIFEETLAPALNLNALLGPDFLETFLEVKWRLENHARTAALVLESEDDSEVAGEVISIMNVLFPGEAQVPDKWWATPLGRVVAMSIGHPDAENVSYSVAGAMLGGISKQRIGALVDEGKLDRHPDGGVTVVSIQQRLEGSRGTGELPGGGAAPA
ncbi:hypothetical protein [Streptomyces sp. NPDC047315]|uniref:hypothetical protein n=1 Tax=Streptomyces sp. NPDC047315 TaxID=3155142 RepID=UPI00341063C8